MKLASKNEQIIYVYFVAKKKKKNLCFYFIYIIFIWRIYFVSG